VERDVVGEDLTFVLSAVAHDPHVELGLVVGEAGRLQELDRRPVVPRLGEGAFDPEAVEDRQTVHERGEPLALVQVELLSGRVGEAELGHARVCEEHVPGRSLQA